jgi:hypothetical protein
MQQTQTPSPQDEQREQDLEKRERELARREKALEAGKLLGKQNLPKEALSLVNLDSRETMLESIKTLLLLKEHFAGGAPEVAKPETPAQDLSYHERLRRYSSRFSIPYNN